MINNELKWYLLAYVDTRFTFDKSDQPATRTYNYRSVPTVPERNIVVYRLINNGIWFFIYIDQNADHVKIITYTLNSPLKIIISALTDYFPVDGMSVQPIFMVNNAKHTSKKWKLVEWSYTEQNIILFRFVQSI